MSDCGPAPSLTDGSATATSLTAISFTCDNGFDLVGTATINCLDPTGWETGPSCQCPALTAPTNGGVDKTSGTTAVGGIATYTCDATFTLSGTATRTCVSGTGWDGSAPTCVASTNDCESLVNSSNGQVAAPATTEGSMGIYSCNSGYTLVGSSSRACGASGWSGSEPTCQQDSKADALVFSTWLAVASSMLIIAML
ncbi:E-selectin-like [Mya arenaria]|uniref:E-selectin-like n=1 Tax=Mya arenaria TaxID=6604 RepID=UPI0022E6CFFD|nr:E-selectin-like [Mya arenaria]